MKRGLAFIVALWPACGRCGQSCTGSYFGRALCYRCGEPPSLRRFDGGIC